MKTEEILLIRFDFHKETEQYKLAKKVQNRKKKKLPISKKDMDTLNSYLKESDRNITRSRGTHSYGEDFNQDYSDFGTES